MVHHISLLEVKPSVTPEQLESIMVETRIRLLKIPEINNLRVGKRIETKTNPYTYFFSMDLENLDKLKYAQDSAVYTQFQKQVLDPYTSKFTSFNYEMEPGKDVRYS
ncbi:MAG: hypothetical protein B9S32_16340 [Verrucomicrobia bacterium Tous-C9LFEB]|nr:MAG: hypothetical protein B9S32_16340 [Verrucomicrobia bacterium Tous-C9LFEB]